MKLPNLDSLQAMEMKSLSTPELQKINGGGFWADVITFLFVGEAYKVQMNQAAKYDVTLYTVSQ